MEVTNIISGLTVRNSIPLQSIHCIHSLTLFQNPPNVSLPAFHVVAPSLPGFGFSPAPKKSGMGPRQMAHVFQSLMLQLNYPKYVVQGGDWGGIVLRYIAADFPDSVPSALSNFWVIQPNATDFARYEAGTSTPDEEVAIQGFNSFFKGLGGYFYEQQLHPLHVAHLLTDSPVGNAMWIYDLMYHSVEDFWWTPKEIITWSMMYWIQGPYSGARIYRESLLVSLFQELNEEPTDISPGRIDGSRRICD
jgi:pimeloyl-ACP methyl ester carboxylesterase